MGFPKYFEKKGIDTSRWVFYPNGVDNIFLNQAFDRPNQTNSKKLITYAGNIGYAQALEKIIPFVAKNLNENFDFLIIGDGSTRDKLVSAIKKNNIKNVKIVKPMNRKLLLDYYRKSDILFLHLDDTPAFMRVLPSKLFEYAAMGKPIVAGLQGYSRAFSKNHIPYAFIFEPGNVEECVSKITESINAIVTKREVDSFTENFSRKRLMNSFADDILNTISIK
jgi:glycosyltransferase involved in cell wall biosynthesis